MNKRFAKKPICLLLLTALLSAGCGSAADTPGSPDRRILPESLQELSFDEHLNISIGYWNIDGMAGRSEPDALQNYIEELFNITITPIPVTWANYKERYKILSTTNSLPDVFATLTLSSNASNDSAFYYKMIRDGSIRPLPEDLSSFPALSGLMESVSYIKNPDGFFYAIPRTSFSDPILEATDAAILVRKDWMENPGCSNPESFEGFAEMTAAFAMKDPDGNGLDDTAGYNVNTLNALGKWLILGIAPECNVYSWIERDGRYVPSWTTEEFDRVVACYRQLYETGGLDPDFYTKSPTIVLEDFAAGRLGALEYKSSPSALLEAKTEWQLHNDKPFEECVAVLPIFPAEDGIRYSNSSSAFWSESYLSSAVDNAKAERILALFEFLLSPQGQELYRYGLENIDYRHTENGECECLLALGNESLRAVLLKKYPSISLFATLASWDCSWKDFEENSLSIYTYGEDCVRLASESIRWQQENTVQLERPYDFLIYPKEPSDLFGTVQAFDEFIKCIIGTEDPIEMWHAALERMYRQGLEEYIDRQNDNYRKRL